MPNKHSKSVLLFLLIAAVLLALSIGTPRTSTHYSAPLSLSLLTSGNWDNSNSQQSTIECSNLASLSALTKLSLNDYQDQILGDRFIEFPAFGSAYISLNDFSGTQDNYGTYTLSSADNSNTAIICHSILLQQDATILIPAQTLPNTAGSKTTLSAPVNTTDNIQNWLKLYTSSPEPVEANITLYAADGTQISTNFSQVTVQDSVELPIHKQSGPDFIGQVIITAPASAELGAELVRVFLQEASDEIQTRALTSSESTSSSSDYSTSSSSDTSSSSSSELSSSSSEYSSSSSSEVSTSSSSDSSSSTGRNCACPAVSLLCADTTTFDTTCGDRACSTNNTVSGDPNSCTIILKNDDCTTLDLSTTPSPVHPSTLEKTYEHCMAYASDSSKSHIDRADAGELCCALRHEAMHTQDERCFDEITTACIEKPTYADTLSCQQNIINAVCDDLPSGFSSADISTPPPALTDVIYACRMVCENAIRHSVGSAAMHCVCKRGSYDNGRPLPLTDTQRTELQEECLAICRGKEDPYPPDPDSQPSADDMPLVCEPFISFGGIPADAPVDGTTQMDTECNGFLSLSISSSSSEESSSSSETSSSSSMGFVSSSSSDDSTSSSSSETSSSSSVSFSTSSSILSSESSLSSSLSSSSISSNSSASLTPACLTEGNYCNAEEENEGNCCEVDPISGNNLACLDGRCRPSDCSTGSCAGDLTCCPKDKTGTPLECRYSSCRRSCAIKGSYCNDYSPCCSEEITGGIQLVCKDDNKCHASCPVVGSEEKVYVGEPCVNSSDCCPKTHAGVSVSCSNSYCTAQCPPFSSYNPVTTSCDCDYINHTYNPTTNSCCYDTGDICTAGNNECCPSNSALEPLSCKRELLDMYSCQATCSIASPCNESRPCCDNSPSGPELSCVGGRCEAYCGLNARSENGLCVCDDPSQVFHYSPTFSFCYTPCQIGVGLVDESRQSCGTFPGVGHNGSLDFLNKLCCDVITQDCYLEEDLAYCVSVTEAVPSEVLEAMEAFYGPTLSDGLSIESYAVDSATGEHSVVHIRETTSGTDRIIITLELGQDNRVEKVTEYVNSGLTRMLKNRYYDNGQVKVTINKEYIDGVERKRTEDHFSQAGRHTHSVIRDYDQNGKKDRLEKTVLSLNGEKNYTVIELYDDSQRTDLKVVNSFAENNKISKRNRKLFDDNGKLTHRQIVSCYINRPTKRRVDLRESNHPNTNKLRCQLKEVYKSSGAKKSSECAYTRVNGAVTDCHQDCVDETRSYCNETEDRDCKFLYGNPCGLRE